MNLKTETFYAIQCDFPDCGELLDGDEYTYTYDPYSNSDLAIEYGWFINGDTVNGIGDYCPTHTVEIDCPEEGFSTDRYGEKYCQWCEDHSTDTHLAPMEDTFENALKLVEKAMIDSAHSKLNTLEWNLGKKIGTNNREYDRNSLYHKLTNALNDVYDRTVVSWDPELETYLFSLRNGQYFASKAAARIDFELFGTGSSHMFMNTIIPKIGKSPRELYAQLRIKEADALVDAYIANEAAKDCWKDDV